MPKTDLADIIAALSPLRFALAAEAPDAPARLYLVAPGNDADWAIAHKVDNAWYDDASGMRMDEPLLYAVLPLAPFKHQHRLETMVKDIAEELANGQFDQAARLIDQLADQVRAVRDAPLTKVARDLGE